MSEVTESVLFRQKLYDNFKDSGMLSKLKTSLRMNLLQKLQRPQLNVSSTLNSDSKKPLYLRDKFLACIALQYLKKSGKEYSFSILLPEAFLEEGDCLNYDELAEIVNLQRAETDGVSFLEAMVSEWTQFRATEIREKSTQTDYSEPISKTLEQIEKKYLPEMEYWKLMPNKESNQSSISLLAKEQRMKEDFEVEKKRAKRELEAVVRAEVQKKLEDRYSARMKEVQKAHETRLFQLKNREKTVLDGLERKKKDLELKSRQVSDKQLQMISKYQIRIQELELDYRNRLKQLEAKEKQFHKRQLQLKAKKRQYEETIQLVKHKVIEQTTNV